MHMRESRFNHCCPIVLRRWFFVSFNMENEHYLIIWTLHFIFQIESGTPKIAGPLGNCLVCPCDKTALTTVYKDLSYTYYFNWIYKHIIYYSKEVKGQRKVCDHFCKYVFCVNIIFGGHMTFFHQGNKLLSNQKLFFVCFLFVSHQRIILSLVVTI